LTHPDKLMVLGNGYQKKSYLHVSDCIEAIRVALIHASSQVNIFNLGVDGFCEVRESIAWITDELGLKPDVSFGTESKGWIGDNPLIHLDISRIQELGWAPKHTIQESVRETVKFLQRHPNL
jgi:UDP-glucose 4-epimerase